MIQFESLKPNHGILERKDGSMSFSSLDKSINSLLKVADCDREDLILAEQTHSKNVFFCPSDIKGYIKLGVDGLITETKGQVLVIKTADCVPLLMYDGKRVGILHAGKKGLFNGIIEEAFPYFDKDSLIVGIGPHIRKCCYNKEVKGEWLNYSSDGFLDLNQIVRDKLKGIQIEDCGICTSCSSNFFSYRRRDDCCFASFISLK